MFPEVMNKKQKVLSERDEEVRSKQSCSLEGDERSSVFVFLKTRRLKYLKRE